MMLRFLVVPAILLLIGANSSYGERFALLVGQNNGGGALTSLKYAEKDVRSFSALLNDIGGFKSSKVITLLHPDSAELDEQLGKIKKRISEDKDGSDLFLFYFSGHADGKSLLLGNTSFPLKKIETYLGQIPSDIKIGIFDACQSGVVVSFKGGTRAEPFYFKDQQTVKGQIIIASSTANERAQESETLKSSLFTFHWLNGLRGSADISGDRKVTLNEAYQYAYCKTIETSALATGEIQHPVFRFSISGQGDIVLTDLQKEKSGILVDGSCRGKFLILSDNYIDVFGDFYKESDKEWFVSLNPGKYTIVNAREKFVGTHEFQIGRNDFVVLSNSMLVPNTITESRLKGTEPDKEIHVDTLKTHVSGKFSSGIGTGMTFRLTSWEQEMINFLLSWANSVYITDQSKLFWEGSWYVYSSKLSGDFGLDYFWKKRLYTGAGVGLLYSNEEKGPLLEKIGPLCVFHVGLTSEIGKNTILELQLPYRVSFISKPSHSIGLEIQLLFSAGKK